MNYVPFVFTLVLAFMTIAAGQSVPSAPLNEAATHPFAKSPHAMRIVSFNIRYANSGDGADAWPKRREAFVRAVRALDPDLLGLQEVLAAQQDDLTAALADYDSVAVGREDGKRRGEAAAVYFRRDRFTLVDHGTFWLSPTPEKVGSVGWDAALTRVCTWAVLRENATHAGAEGGREILFANTHFDHRGEAARTESATLIVARLATLAAGRTTVLTGDLNSTEDSPAYAALVATPAGIRGSSAPASTRPTTSLAPSPTTLPSPALRLIDAYRHVHPKRLPDEATFHAFRGDARGSRIDYVFTSPDFTATAAGIDRERTADGRLPSDHFAVWADLRRTPGPTTRP